MMWYFYFFKYAVSRQKKRGFYRRNDACNLILKSDFDFKREKWKKWRFLTQLIIFNVKVWLFFGLFPLADTFETPPRQTFSYVLEKGISLIASEEFDSPNRMPIIYRLWKSRHFKRSNFFFRNFLSEMVGNFRKWFRKFSNLPENGWLLYKNI